MILVHLSMNGKAAICDPQNILFAEECDGQDEQENPVSFTRIYLKQPLPGENGSMWLDVQESVDKILKSLKK